MTSDPSHHAPRFGADLAQRVRPRTGRLRRREGHHFVGVVGRSSVGFGLAVGRSSAIRPIVDRSNLDSIALRPPRGWWLQSSNEIEEMEALDGQRTEAPVPQRGRAEIRRTPTTSWTQRLMPQESRRRSSPTSRTTAATLRRAGAEADRATRGRTDAEPGADKFVSTGDPRWDALRRVFAAGLTPNDLQGDTEAIAAITGQTAPQAAKSSSPPQRSDTRVTRRADVIAGADSTDDAPVDQPADGTWNRNAAENRRGDTSAGSETGPGELGRRVRPERVSADQVARRKGSRTAPTAAPSLVVPGQVGSTQPDPRPATQQRSSRTTFEQSDATSLRRRLEEHGLIAPRDPGSASARPPVRTDTAPPRSNTPRSPRSPRPIGQTPPIGHTAPTGQSGQTAPSRRAVDTTPPAVQPQADTGRNSRRPDPGSPTPLANGGRSTGIAVQAGAPDAIDARGSNGDGRGASLDIEHRLAATMAQVPDLGAISVVDALPLAARTPLPGGGLVDHVTAEALPTDRPAPRQNLRLQRMIAAGRVSASDDVRTAAELVDAQKPGSRNTSSNRTNAEVAEPTGSPSAHDAPPPQAAPVTAVVRAPRHLRRIPSLPAAVHDHETLIRRLTIPRAMSRTHRPDAGLAAPRPDQRARRPVDAADPVEQVHHGDVANATVPNHDIARASVAPPPVRAWADTSRSTGDRFAFSAGDTRAGETIDAGENPHHASRRKRVRHLTNDWSLVASGTGALGAVVRRTPVDPSLPSRGVADERAAVAAERIADRASVTQPHPTRGKALATSTVVNSSTVVATPNATDPITDRVTRTRPKAPAPPGVATTPTLIDPITDRATSTSTALLGTMASRRSRNGSVQRTADRQGDTTDTTDTSAGTRDDDDLAARFMSELSRSIRSRPAPLPTQFQPLADQITGGRKVMLSTDAATRRALRSVGKVAATTGDTIHLDPAATTAVRMNHVLAHELTHVANPSPVARFFDDVVDSPEERQAEATAKVMARSPLAPTSSILGAPGSVARRSAAGGSSDTIRRSPARAGTTSSPGTISAESLAASITGTTPSPSRGATSRSPSNDVIRRAWQPATPTAERPASSPQSGSHRQEYTADSSAQATQKAPFDPDSTEAKEWFAEQLEKHADAIVRLLGDRLVTDLERRGGRMWGGI